MENVKLFSFMIQSVNESHNLLPRNYEGVLVISWSGVVVEALRY